MGLLYGRAGRLTALFGDFRPGQWVGLSDYDHECGCNGDCFEWSDGTPNDYTNWADGEPNDWKQDQYSANCDDNIGSVGDDDGGEDCVHIRGDYKWNEAVSFLAALTQATTAVPFSLV